MADVKKPVDLDGLGVAIGEIKKDYAKKSDIPEMNFATKEEILALFEDSKTENLDGEVNDSF